MVVDQPLDAAADRVFHALADGTRRRIVALVLTDERSVTDLARQFPMSFAAVQKHVVVLERAGLVVKIRVGREARVRGRVDGLQGARLVLDELEDIWRGRLDRIEDLLAESADRSPTTEGEHR